MIEYNWKYQHSIWWGYKKAGDNITKTRLFKYIEKFTSKN